MHFIFVGSSSDVVTFTLSIKARRVFYAKFGVLFSLRFLFSFQWPLLRELGGVVCALMLPIKSHTVLLARPWCFTWNLWRCCDVYTLRSAGDRSPLQDDRCRPVLLVSGYCTTPALGATDIVACTVRPTGLVMAADCWHVRCIVTLCNVACLTPRPSPFLTHGSCVYTFCFRSGFRSLVQATAANVQ